MDDIDTKYSSRRISWSNTFASGKEGITDVQNIKGRKGKVSHLESLGPQERTDEEGEDLEEKYIENYK